MRVVFLGTPAFAAASLQAIVDAGYNVVGVITAPDKPAGRGMQLQQSAVKQLALKLGLYVMQPEKLKNNDFLAELKALHADVQVVVAFRMLPEVVWNMPPHGTINVHASLLPQYRGAAPINWAIINGEKETGITTFKLKHEIDTGNLLLQQSLIIGEDETAGELHDRLMNLGSSLIVKTLHQIEDGSAEEVPQVFNGEVQLKHAPKLFTQTCIIDPTQTAVQVHNLIRGLSPVPAAVFNYSGKKYKIYRSKLTSIPGSNQPGEMFTSNQRLFISCGDDDLEIKEIQQEGKKRLTAEQFINGFRNNA